MSIVDRDLHDRPIDTPVAETSHPLQTKDIHFAGLTLHIQGTVFVASAAALFLFIAVTLAAPQIVSTALMQAKQFVLSELSFVFMSVAAAAVLLCTGIALSPAGTIRLGGPQAKPQFSIFAWLAMLFAAGVGTGMMFYGTAEPLAYYSGWAGNPLGVSPYSEDARRLAFSATLYHWGLTPWSLYALTGLALAYFAFNRGLPLTIRSAFAPILGNYTWRWPGHLIDVCAVIATVFGLATTLGFGATLASNGLQYAYGLSNTLALQIALIVVVTSVAIGSVALGLTRGIQRLSTANVLLAFVLLLFILCVGPFGSILSTLASALTDYMPDSLRLSRWWDRSDQSFYWNWTLLYWAWWIAWAPFVGLFIARISYGRTVRTFICAVVLVPTLVGAIWFGAFGQTALHLMDNQTAAYAGGIAKDYLVIWQTLEVLPWPQISSALALGLLFVFFVTSSDSGSLVVDILTAGGQLEPPKVQRVFWASLEGLVAIILLTLGGAGALGSLQNAVFIAGLPFAIIVLFLGVSVFFGLLKDAYKDAK